MKLQGFQQRVAGTLTQPHPFADIGDLKFGGLLVELVEDLQRTFNRLNNRHNVGMCMLELRQKRTFFGGKSMKMSRCSPSPYGRGPGRGHQRAEESIIPQASPPSPP